MKELKKGEFLKASELLHFQITIMTLRDRVLLERDRLPDKKTSFPTFHCMIEIVSIITVLNEETVAVFVELWCLRGVCAQEDTLFSEALGPDGP